MKKPIEFYWRENSLEKYLFYGHQSINMFIDYKARKAIASEMKSSVNVD